MFNLNAHLKRLLVQIHVVLIKATEQDGNEQVWKVRPIDKCFLLLLFVFA